MPKERIIERSQELFFKQGIRSVTMDDIAAHLGMSKKTIYSFFRDKDEIVNALMEEKIADDTKRILGVCTAHTNVIEQVFGIMKHITEMFSQLNPIIFYDLQKYHPDAWKKFKEFKEGFMMKVVEQNIEDGKKQGYVRPDINTRILARMRIEQIEMGMNTDLFPQGKFRMVDVQLALLEHFLYGICTLKGHKLVNKYKHIVEED